MSGRRNPGAFRTKPGGYYEENVWESTDSFSGSFSGTSLCRLRRSRRLRGRRQPAPAGEPEETRTLHLFHYDLSLVEGNELLAEAFTESTGITTTAEMVASEHMAVLTSRDAAGNLPDIFDTGAYGNEAVRTWVEAGKIQPVDDLAVIKALPEEIRADLTFSDGHIYQVPTYLQPVGVIYNKAMFEANNLEVPETYDDFVRVVETLKEAGITPFAIGAKDAWTVGTCIWSPGIENTMPEGWVETRWAEGTGSFSDFADPVFDVIDLALANCQPNPLETDFGGLGALFATEEVAMIFHGDWILGDVLELNPEMAENAGMFAIPFSNDASRNLLHNITKYYFVSAEADIDAVDQFFSFAYASDEGRQIYSDYFSVPNIYGLEYANNAALRDVKVYADAGRMTTDSYNVNIPEGFWQNEGLALQDFIAGKTDRQATMARLDAEWDSLAGK